MTNPTALASAPEFYSWQAQDGKIRVHLSIAAVAQMQADVQTGLKRIPKRGAEVGGILLGSAEEIKNVRTITVHNFQPFECEYSTGPSWTLSSKDISLLESVLRKLNGTIDVEQTIVGFYRSNTRERLALSGADLDLIEKYFPEQRHTFLLIQPQLGRTASIEFSYWAGGQVCSAPNRLELRSTPGAFAPGALPATARKAVPPASLIRSGGPHARLAPAEMPPTPLDTRPAPIQARPETPPEAPPALPDTPAVQRQALPETPEILPAVCETRLVPPKERPETPEILPTPCETRLAPPEACPDTAATLPTLHDTRLAPPQAKPRGLSRLVYAALGILTVAILAVAVLVYQGRRSESGATSLALQVERRADKLILSWNPTAVELQAAHRVTLSIRDGRDEKTVELNVKQLLEGRLYYAPATRDVKLSLELYLDHDRRVGESVYLPRDELVKPAGATPPPVAPSPSQPRASESPVRLTPSLSAQGASKAPATLP